MDISFTNLPATASDKEIHTAFEDYQAEARDVFGRRGYTGSISEACGVSIRRDLFYPDENTAWQQVFDHTSKWGPALAIVIGDRIALAGCYSS